MPLSEYESRVLERLEQEFTITDPELSRWLATGAAALPGTSGRQSAGRMLSGLPRGRRIPLPLLHLPAAPPIVLVSVLLMVLGAILLGVAAVNGWFVAFGAAAAAYVAGLVPLIVWNRRRGGRF